MYLGITKKRDSHTLGQFQDFLMRVRVKILFFFHTVRIVRKQGTQNVAEFKQTNKNSVFLFSVPL